MNIHERYLKKILRISFFSALILGIFLKVSYAFAYVPPIAVDFAVDYANDYKEISNSALLVDTLKGNQTGDSYTMPEYRSVSGGRAVEFTDKNGVLHSYVLTVDLTYCSAEITKGLILSDSKGNEKTVNTLYYTYVTDDGTTRHYVVTPDSIYCEVSSFGIEFTINGYTYYAAEEPTPTPVHIEDIFDVEFTFDNTQRSYTVNLNNVWSYYDYIDGFKNIGPTGTASYGYYPLYFNTMNQFFDFYIFVSFEDMQYSDTTTLYLFISRSYSNNQSEKNNYSEFQKTGYYSYNDEFVYNNTYNYNNLPDQITNLYNEFKNDYTTNNYDFSLPDLNLPNLDLPNLPGIDLPDLPNFTLPDLPDLPDNPDLPDIPGGSVWIPPKYDKINTTPIITTRSNVELSEVTFPTSVLSNGGTILESGLDGLTDCMPELVSVALVCMVFGFLWKFTGG